MAQPFSPQQRDAIREKLKESARKYAVSTGVKKTSLDMLTADAGISKSSFYKFYDSKELLFLEIAADWESQIIAAVNESLTKDAAAGLDDKRRSANSVYAAFTTIHALGICNFLCDDLPELARFIPEEDARTHYLSSAQGIFDMLRRAKIHFSQSDETVLAAIRILYLSIININRIGTDFFPALHLLVIGACEELVALAQAAVAAIASVKAIVANFFMVDVLPNSFNSAFRLAFTI